MNEITVQEFRDAITRGDWSAMAEIVRHYTNSPTFRGINEDILCDWITEGAWTGDETPEAVAAEWDRLSD